MRRIQVIDSHTAGEPTRVVVAGGPELPSAFIREQLAELRDRHDWLRAAVVTEPRGSDVVVGALLCEPMDRSCAAGVIFFNNVGYLGMCGHGAIGVAVTLAHLGRIGPGEQRFETPVGVVKVSLEDRNTVSFENVESYRAAGPLTVDVPGFGPVTGDVAWGGNWFFLVEAHGQDLTLSNVPLLTDFTRQIRQALTRQGITGRGGAEIDHIELFGPPTRPDADSRNFVLCPGGAYDRSPCGTGTSAKLACLYHDGKLRAR
jgi:4-hydroxyproline epimerase